jgi:hypothetical protein
MTGIATEADYVLIPEDPPEEGWENKIGEVQRALSVSFLLTS